MARRKPSHVRLVWKDIAAHDGTWVERKRVKPEPAIMESIGWLVYDREDYVILAQDYHASNDMVAGLSTYPRGCIISLTLVKEQTDG